MANVKLASKAVGSIVKLKVNGTAKEFIVVHQGKPSSIYDESCNGTWLLMKDIYEKRQWHSSKVNKYESSYIHAYLNNTFFNLFDSNIRDSIKQVKIPYRKNGGSGGTDQSGANGLSSKIFLLSGYEVGWTTSDSQYFPQDGAKLNYFESGAGASANDKRIAKLNGSATNWWLRSPHTNNTANVRFVISNGDWNGDVASLSYGIRPALILPSNVLVDDSGNVVIPDLTAHKTLVNGTIYTVRGGKCLVNGTVYDIKKGRTLINGTGVDILFEAETFTWLLNEDIEEPNGEFVAEFVCEINGRLHTYYGMIAEYDANEDTQMLHYYRNKEGSRTDNAYNFSTFKWDNIGYQTITFKQMPSGALLSWLNNNGFRVK